MASVSNYYFNNLGRIGEDSTDITQRTVSNTKFANYMLSNFVSDKLSDSHVNFATQQPTMMFSGTAHGAGIGAAVIDSDSQLMLNTTNERPLEKLQLMQRPFITVPYLGRGAGDPTLESQLQQGEIVHDKKSVSTVTEQSFTGFTMFHSDDKMAQRANDPANSIEESALDGWTRGGMASREMSSDNHFKMMHRPTDSAY